MPILPAPDNQTSQEITLYGQLLQCLEEEWQALKASREQDLLALAARKEEILGQLMDLSPSRRSESPEAGLAALRRQAAVAQNRNRRLIIAALEVIQEFLSRLQPDISGTYLAAGKMAGPSGASYFRRQA